MYALIITGCIAPSSNVSVLYLKNIEERKKQYIDSIKWYIDNSLFEHIIFCDNSNYRIEEDLTSYAKVRQKSFEYLTFSGNKERTVLQGKGYGEGEIIYFAIQHSELLKQCDGFVKITGRLIVQNINLIYRNLRGDRFYYLTASSILKNKTPLVETRIYAISKKMYLSYFLYAYENVDDNNKVFLETVFRDIILENKIKGYNFSAYPDFRGQSGSTGISYRTSSVKILLKSILVRMGMYRIHTKEDGIDL